MDNKPTNSLQASPIADLSYRNFEGALGSPNLRWWVIAKTMMQVAFKKPALKWYALVSIWYYAAIIAGVFFLEQVSNIGGAPGGPNPLRDFVSKLVWKDQFLHGFGFSQLFLLAVGLSIGAGSIANDNRANALLVYLSKPVSKLDYVLGKWVGIFVPLFAITAGPALIFYAYGAMRLNTYGFISDDPFLLPKVLIATLLTASFQASVLLGISSMFNQGRIAGATYAGLYFLGNFFTQIMTIAWVNLGFSDPPSPLKPLVHNLWYASFDGLNIGLFKLILRTDGTPPFGMRIRGGDGAQMVGRPDLWVVVVPMLVIGGLSLLIAWRRVRAVEVVGS